MVRCEARIWPSAAFCVAIRGAEVDTTRFLDKMTTTPYIDFHTHHPSREGETVLQDGVHTWGAHPWHLAFPPEERLPQAMAIGECGLDRLCNTPYDAQMEAFRRQIRLSEQLQKPLILHCVRAVDDVLRLKREERASQPWIFHAFRGKPAQMRSLLAHGLYVCFGFRYNEESLRECPADRLLLETDDDPRPVSLLYGEAAQVRQIDIQTLQNQMLENFNRLFNPL